MTRPLTLALCSVVALGLAACQRTESPPASAAVEAPAFAPATPASIDVAATHDESGVVYEAAQARHREALAAAQGRLDAALQGCESLQGAAQADCRQGANTAYASDRESAELALEVARRRADYINRS